VTPVPVATDKDGPERENDGKVFCDPRSEIRKAVECDSVSGDQLSLASFDVSECAESIGLQFIDGLDRTWVTSTPENYETAEREAIQGAELDASMRRLEATGVCIAIWETGEMRIVITEDETLAVIDGGAVIYSPADTRHYIQLEPHERRMLHEFKRRFGGTTEWKVKL
jgi:uncharacterized cupin superfamily protein